MKRILKISGSIIAGVIILFVILVFTLHNKTFDRPYPKITASTDSAMIARGKHLVYGPAHCADCHIPKEDIPKRLAGEEVELKGGFEFVLPIGTIRSRNITSDKETGIGALSDAQVARVLREGVFPDGKAVFDFMPFYNLSDYDLTSIISYLRTLPPVRNEIVHREMNFIGKAMMAFAIAPVGPTGTPPDDVTPDTTSSYGKYIAHSVANCVGCHTQRDLMTGAFIGPNFAGGFQMESDIDPELIFTSPNLTPDPETGRIAGWNKEIFLHRFTEGVKIAGTPMPWHSFKNMTELELTAVYKYLNSVEPIHNEVKTTVAHRDSL